MNTLSDYQIAEGFGDTLSLIYKAKMAELNNALAPYYAHIDKLDCPQYTDLDRLFAHETAACVITDAVRNREAIGHIQKIRHLYKKIKDIPESDNFTAQIHKARSIPIDSIYPFKRKGRNVACPFHGDDAHPSASIKFNKLICFTCGIKLDGIGVFMKINNLKFKEAVQALCA